MNFQTRRLTDLRAYENNPRDNSQAISKVKESIRRYGYKVPIVIDSNNVIVAGHTRYAALLQLNQETGQYAEITVIIASDLDENQLKQFRIVDNQVANIATWDFTALQLELSTIEDFILEDFGVIPGFDTDIHLAEDIVPETEETGVKFSFGSDKFTMTEAEYHQWASWVVGQHGCSVLEYVRNQLHIDPTTRTYQTNDQI